MSRESAADVLICGAGAAGLTLAIDLARRGVCFRLIDKMADPLRGSRGKGIQPRTQEIFEDLGILDGSPPSAPSIRRSGYTATTAASQSPG